jgi:hypothetical protein
MGLVARGALGGARQGRRERPYAVPYGCAKQTDAAGKARTSFRRQRKRSRGRRLAPPRAAPRHSACFAKPSSSPLIVRVSPKAAARIRDRGGRLYLWVQPVGAAFVRDRLAFDRVAGPWDFECVESSGVEICVARDVAASEIRVEPRRWPLRGLRAWVDGKRWGRRGDATNGATGA